MNYKQLTENERYQIYVMNKADHSQKNLAYFLGRSPSTISRELHRNQGHHGYRPSQAQNKSDTRRKIKNRIDIDERPSVVGRRNRIGDWEGDTVMGKNRKSALLTMVERKTLYTVIARLTGKRADLLADAAIKIMKPLRDKVKTITLDNGQESAGHEKIAKDLNADIYFAHPYCSWERGINENTNGLIRQYFPKGMDLSEVTDDEIQFVMDRLNNRPRATRKGRTPNELFKGQQVDLLAA